MQTTTEQPYIIPGIMDKIRAIKEKISLETFDMSFQELSEYLKPYSNMKPYKS
jgi:hypothetical protein